MQTLDVKIAIPEDYVLVKRIDFERQIKNDLTGIQWSMADLESATGRKSNWLKENVLYVYRDELDINNGGFVRYPEKSGSPWKFGAKRMKEWMEENLERVM